MTWAQFKDAVISFVNRSSASLVTTGATDLVIIAANMAKSDAQRRHHFKMARTQALITTSIDGVDLSTATTLAAGTISIKKVEQAWSYTTNGSNYRRTLRLPAQTLGDLKNEYPSISSMPILTSAYQFPPVGTWDSFWYIQGTKIYVGGTTTSLSLLLDVIQWMPDYDGTISDFFITYHFDWMILRTVQILNRYLKDGEQIAISQGELRDLWTSVVNFDENFSEDNFESGSND